MDPLCVTSGNVTWRYGVELAVEIVTSPNPVRELYSLVVGPQTCKDDVSAMVTAVMHESAVIRLARSELDRNIFKYTNKVSGRRKLWKTPLGKWPVKVLVF